MTDKNCADDRFQEAGPPEGFSNPADVYDPKLSKVIAEENKIRQLSGEAPYDPLEVGSPSPKEQGDTGGPRAGTAKNQKNAEGAFVLSLAEISALCRDTLDPQMVSGLLIQILVSHFRDPDSFFNQDLKELRWTEDPSTNKIRITTLTRWDPKGASQVPALVVSRGDTQFSRIAIGDSDAVGKSGEETFTRKVASTYKIICIGGTAAESELLAFEVTRFLTIFSPALRRRTPAFNIEVDQLSSLVQIEEMSNQLGVFVALHLEFPWTWGISEQGPILKSFTLKTPPTA